MRSDQGYCLHRGVGQYVAAETHDFAYGSRTGTGARLVITCQGSHSVADSLVSADTWDRTRALAGAGYVVICGDLSQTASQGTFGNDTAQTRVGQLRTFATASGVGGSAPPLLASTAKLYLLAGSGGFTDAVNYARANPSLVAAVYGICPLVDVEDFYSNWTGGGANGTTPAASGVTQAEINKAYNGGVDDGGTAYTAAMATHNPSRSGNQAALAGVAIRLAYSTDDPLIPVSKVTAYAALVNAAGGSATAYSQGAVGHSGTGIDPGDVVAFFNAHP